MSECLLPAVEDQVRAKAAAEAVGACADGVVWVEFDWERVVDSVPFVAVVIERGFDAEWKAAEFRAEVESAWERGYQEGVWSALRSAAELSDREVRRRARRQFFRDGWASEVVENGAV